MEQSKSVAHPDPEEKSLAGMTILVTRAGPQAQPLTRQLELAGAQVVVLPTIEIQPPEDFIAFDAAVAKIATYDWVIFTSVNSVAPFLDRLRRAGKNSSCLVSLQVGAIGPETAKRLDAAGVHPTLLPTRYQAEGILDALTPDSIKGRRVLIPRAAEAREVLPQTLRDWGAIVDVVVAYRTTLPNVDVAPIQKLFGRRGIDIVTFTSSSTVKNFVRLFGGGNLAEIVGGGLVACIGPITAQTVEQFGCRPAIIAGEFTSAGLTRAIVEYLRLHPEARSRAARLEDS
jgi:uroporphyrinogen III methyltransferase/synthase